MKIRYRNDLYGNYILIEIPKDQDSSQYSFKMLEKNRISGVLTCKERVEDGRSYWHVDISKKRTLVQEYQDKELHLEDMITIFQQITPILEELRNYLLSENMVVMDPEYIYKDLEDDSLHIMVLPWNSEEKTVHKLAEFFLEKISHRDENGVNAAYHFYRQQNQTNFSWYHFLPILEKESILKRQKIRGKENGLLENSENHAEFWRESGETTPEETNFQEIEEEPKMKNQKRTRLMISVVFLISAIGLLIFGFLPVTRSVIKISCFSFSLLLFIFFLILSFSKEKQEEKIQNNKKDEVFSKQEIDIGMKETVFFDSYECENYLKLQWKERGRKKQFQLKDFPCIVGKMKDEASLVISDISVSRIHCKFIEKENRICIMDLNSTNGTFLNGLPVKNGEILEIEKNDEILIGKVRVSVV